MDAAERLVAERGLHGVRVAEVVKAAGHKNNSAVSYHFGSWQGLLEAVWQRHTEPVSIDRAVIIAGAVDRGDYDLPTMVEAYVRPLVAELSRHQPSYWARFNEQWLATIALEWLATNAWDRWQYAARMPTLPVLGTGLTPLLQWLVLPLLLLWLVRRQLRDVDEQVMMARVGRGHAGGRDTHAAEPETDRDRRGYLGAVRGRDEIDLGTGGRGRAGQSGTAGTLLGRHGADEDQ